MIKIYFIIALFLLNFNGYATEKSYTLQSSVYKNSEFRFLPHVGSGRFGSYLTMQVRYAPIKKLLTQVKQYENLQLKSRGEAHITVVTPIEYFDVLKPAGISMQEINEIATNAKIQESEFKVACVGAGVATLNSKNEKTFYVVVDSTALLKIRKKIAALYISKKGAKAKFDPLAFFPHITLGFTKRDLHLSDGVKKDKASCVADIRVVN